MDLFKVLFGYLQLIADRSATIGRRTYVADTFYYTLMREGADIVPMSREIEAG